MKSRLGFEVRDAMKAFIARRPLLSYFVLAYAVSWSVAVPLALQAQGVVATRLPWALHYLTAFGPAVAALAVARQRGCGRVARIFPAAAARRRARGRPAR